MSSYFRALFFLNLHYFSRFSFPFFFIEIIVALTPSFISPISFDFLLSEIAMDFLDLCHWAASYYKHFNYSLLFPSSQLRFWHTFTIYTLLLIYLLLLFIGLFSSYCCFFIGFQRSEMNTFGNLWVCVNWCVDGRRENTHEHVRHSTMTDNYWNVFSFDIQKLLSRIEMVTTFSLLLSLAFILSLALISSFDIHALLIANNNYTNHNKTASASWFLHSKTKCVRVFVPWNFRLSFLSPLTFNTQPSTTILELFDVKCWGEEQRKTY